MKLHLETDRMWLRPLELSDAEALFILDSDPLVAQYLGAPPVEKPEVSRRIISGIQRQYKQNGVGRLAMVLKENNELIGWCGLKWYDGPLNQVTDFYEIGFRLLPKYWRRGLATEAARAVIADAFETPEVGSIYAYSDTRNKASLMVLEKLGFEYRNLFYDEGDLCGWYELSRDGFRT